MTNKKYTFTDFFLDWLPIIIYFAIAIPIYGFIVFIYIQFGLLIETIIVSIVGLFAIYVGFMGFACLIIDWRG